MTCSKCKYLFSIGDTNNLWCDWREAYLKEYESDCDFGVSYDPDDEDETIVTNRDKIRAMSDEELARFIVRKSQCPDGYTSVFGPHCVEENGCEECWLEWLKMEVS